MVNLVYMSEFKGNFMAASNLEYSKLQGTDLSICVLILRNKEGLTELVEMPEQEMFMTQYCIVLTKKECK